MNKLDILQNFKKSYYQFYPFPHFEIINAYNEKTYELLDKDYNLFIDYFKKNEEFKLNNVRMQICAKEFFESNIFKNSIWFDFVKYHTSIEFFDKIIDIFYKDIINIYPNTAKLFNKLDNNKFLGIRDLKNSKDYNFVIDCQPGINTPCTAEKAVRGPHVDNPVELIGGLFYLKKDDDINLGGDLVIHENNKKKIYFEGKAEVKNVTSLNEYKVFKYQKNHAVFFLNTINSIHSITPRKVTNNIRCLTNIIIETYKIEKKLFILNNKNNLISKFSNLISKFKC